MPKRPQAKPLQGSPAPLWRAALLGAIVLAAALVPNWKSLRYDFVWDDAFVIGQELDVHGLQGLAQLWNTPFDLRLKEQALGYAYFRPVTLMSLAVDRARSGENPRAFHGQNLFWYAAACLFLWLLAWEISGFPVAATAGTVLYALHPTHPESVCFVSGRTDLLAGAFLFGALWVAARFGPRIRSDWKKLVPASIVLLPGLFSKEVALFGAPLLPIALWLRDRKLGGAAIARASAAVGVAVLLYVAARFAVLGVTTAPAIAPVQGFVPQILTSVALVARYLLLLFAPIHLSARHEIPATTQPDIVFWLGLLVLALLAVCAVLAFRRRSRWLLPVILLAATLLPVCWVRILSGALVAERFLFIPSASIAIAVALLPGARAAAGSAGPATKPSGDAAPILLVATAAVAVWWGALLIPRVNVWRDEATLFTAMLREEPNSPHVHGILGGYYYRTRDLERAAYHYRRSYELYPASGEMLLNLVAAEDEMGHADSAFADAHVLNARFPTYGPGWYALGNLYVRVDRPDSARIAYGRAIALMPDFAQAENNLGAVLERMGREEEALAHYRRAQEIRPGYPEAKKNLDRLTATRAARGAKGAERDTGSAARGAKGAAKP
jgi:protein O-mannosyl-transferase